MRFNHVARIIVNANHGVVWAAVADISIRLFALPKACLMASINPRLFCSVRVASTYSIVFILPDFPSTVLAFFDFSSSRSHFWPVTEVVRKMPAEVTRKCAGDTPADTTVTSAGSVRRGALGEPRRGLKA